MKSKLKGASQRGLAIIELMLGFIIIGGFVIGIYQMYSTLSNTAKIDTESKNLQTISSMIKTSFSTAPNFDGLDISMLTHNRSFPQSMKGSAANTIRNSWNSGGVLVGGLEKSKAVIGNSAAGGAGTIAWESNDKYVITYPNVPTDSCFDLVSKTRGFFEEVRVGSNDNAAAVYSIKKANELCNKSAGNTTIYFVGGK